MRTSHPERVLQKVLSPGFGVEKLGAASVNNTSPRSFDSALLAALARDGAVKRSAQDDDFVMSCRRGIQNEVTGVLG
jgi:hypothetical protein